MKSSEQKYSKEIIILNYWRIAAIVPFEILIKKMWAHCCRMLLTKRNVKLNRFTLYFCFSFHSPHSKLYYAMKVRNFRSLFSHSLRFFFFVASRHSILLLSLSYSYHLARTCCCCCGWFCCSLMMLAIGAFIYGFLEGSDLSIGGICWFADTRHTNFLTRLVYLYFCLRAFPSNRRSPHNAYKTQVSQSNTRRYERLIQTFIREIVSLRWRDVYVLHLFR